MPATKLKLTSKCSSMFTEISKVSWLIHKICLLLVNNNTFHTKNQNGIKIYQKIINNFITQLLPDKAKSLFEKLQSFCAHQNR